MNGSGLVAAAISIFLVACGPPAGGKIDPKSMGFRTSEVKWKSGVLRTCQSGLEGGEAPVVIFVHGSPGSAAGWNEYLADEELGTRFRLVAYDRPGYGASGRPWKGLGDQIEALDAVIDSQAGPVILVGHSMGGPIVLGASADREKRVARVIVLAGSIDPGLGPTRPLNAFLKHTRLEALLPMDLRVSNEEVHALKGGLECLAPRLGTVKAPVTVIQGRRDMLVPFANTEYLRRMLTGTEVEVMLLEKEGHFLPWRQFPLVKATLLE